MKTPGWPVLVVALLLGLVTGDSVVMAHSKPPKQHEVTDLAPSLPPLTWPGGDPSSEK